MYRSKGEFMRVLVIDDELEMRELLERNLGRAAHGVKALGSCAAAELELSAAQYDVVILDVVLPDGSGIELCSRLRASGLDTPILLLTALGDVRSRVTGLDAGADDYLAKPFALSELRARVNALGRRGPVRRFRRVVLGAVVVDLSTRRVQVNGLTLSLTAKEFAILEVLATRAGGVILRDDLIASVWGDVTASAGGSLEVLIARIRRKLGASAGMLRTVRGMGYAFEDGTSA
jgi:two-component system, OmpR family, response regulator